MAEEARVRQELYDMLVAEGIKPDFVGVLEHTHPSGKVKRDALHVTELFGRVIFSTIDSMADAVAGVYGDDWKERITYEPLVLWIREGEEYLRFSPEEQELFKKSISESLKQQEIEDVCIDKLGIYYPEHDKGKLHSLCQLISQTIGEEFFGDKNLAAAALAVMYRFGLNYVYKDLDERMVNEEMEFSANLFGIDKKVLGERLRYFKERYQKQ